MEFVLYSQRLGVFKLKHDNRDRKKTKVFFWIYNIGGQDAHYVIYNTFDFVIAYCWRQSLEFHIRKTANLFVSLFLLNFSDHRI